MAKRSTTTKAAKDLDRLTTENDYAALTFEPIHGLEASLGTRAEFMERAGYRWQTMKLATAALAKTPDELAAIATADPRLHVVFLQAVTDLQAKLEAEASVMSTTALRLVAGAFRAEARAP